VVKTGLTVLSVEKVKRSANEKIVFGNVWKLQILAAIIGGPNAWSQCLAKKNRGRQPVRNVDFKTESRWKPN
jgi:hypothetical protein